MGTAERCVAAIVVGLAVQGSPAPAQTIRFPDDRPWASGRIVGLVESGRDLRLAPGHESGEYESPPVTADRPFDRAVPFWNSRTPPGATLELFARVFRGESDLSGWLLVATWSRDRRGPRDGGTPEVTIDQDTLKIAGGADRIQLRARLSGAPEARLSRMGITLYDSTRQPTAGEPPHPARSTALQVRFRSQRKADPKIASRICGPTSLSMALEHFGVRLGTQVVAGLARDPGAGIEYGNWAYLAATAGELGLESEVVALDSLGEVRADLEAGRLVILSLSFGEGQLSGSPMGRTQGHLVLARGFDRRGDLLVNDPAGRTAREGRVRYDRHELARAWRNGIAIRIGPPSR